MYASAPMSYKVCRVQNRVSNPLNWFYSWLLIAMWVLGTELIPYARAASALNCWDISPAPNNICYTHRVEYKTLHTYFNWTIPDQYNWSCICSYHIFLLLFKFYNIFCPWYFMFPDFLYPLLGNFMITNICLLLNLEFRKCA